MIILVILLCFNRFYYSGKQSGPPFEIHHIRVITALKCIVQYKLIIVSQENVVKTLNVSLTNQLLEAVFNDASKYRQAIDSEYITMDTFLV